MNSGHILETVNSIMTLKQAENIMLIADLNESLNPNQNLNPSQGLNLG